MSGLCNGSKWTQFESDNCSPVKPQGVVQFGSIDKDSSLNVCPSQSPTQRRDVLTLGPKDRLFSKLGSMLLEGVSAEEGIFDVMLTGGTKAAANVIGVGGFIACRALS
ncbi:hypothetical protein Tco_0524516 [Tanacetum coccineum]